MSGRSARAGEVGRSGWWIAAVLAALLVLAARLLGFESVFVGDEVFFLPDDSQYHLRRAFGVFSRFPHILLFDPYINHPGGAPVPWPPLFDWTLGAIARLLAADPHGFEVVAAWAGPLCATLTAWPIALVARRAAGPAAGSVPGLAISIYALVPLAVGYSQLRIVDHHAAVSMLGAWLMWCCAARLERDADLARRRRLLAIHVLLRWLIALTWHGSLLYLGVAEATLALGFVWTGRRAIAIDQALGALATALLLAPVLVWMPEPLGGAFSSIALSWLHVSAMLAVAGVAGAAALLAERGSLPTPGRRVLAMGVLSIAIALGLLAAEGPRSGLLPAYQFVSMTDAMGQTTSEQTPLFGFFGRDPVRPATRAWGWLAYLIPFAPFVAWAWGRRRAMDLGARSASYVVAFWSLVFGVLAMSQRRYGNDLAPSVCIAFALGFVVVGEWLVSGLRKLRGGPAPIESGRWGPVATGIAVALVIGTAWPGIRDLHGPRLANSWKAVRGNREVVAGAQRGVNATLTRFLIRVRESTPRTAGYFEEDAEPEYGIIGHADLGHAIQYAARRPTATDPFWSYIGARNWELSKDFHEASDERLALLAADALDARYVITLPLMPPDTVVRQLHAANGSRLADHPALARFRLVAQAPEGAPSLWALFGSGYADRMRKISPYKLFEIVPGAIIEVGGERGEKVTAALDVRVRTGRAFVYRTEAVVGIDGVARLHVPYAAGPGSAAEPGAQVFAAGPYRVESNGREWRVHVSERAVRTGDVVVVDPEADASR